MIHEGRSDLQLDITRKVRFVAFPSCFLLSIGSCMDNCECFFCRLRDLGVYLVMVTSSCLPASRENHFSAQTRALV